MFCSRIAQVQTQLSSHNQFTGCAIKAFHAYIPIQKVNICRTLSDLDPTTKIIAWIAAQSEEAYGIMLLQ